MPIWNFCTLCVSSGYTFRCFFLRFFPFSARLFEPTFSLSLSGEQSGLFSCLRSSWLLTPQSQRLPIIIYRHKKIRAHIASHSCTTIAVCLMYLICEQLTLYPLVLVVKQHSPFLWEYNMTLSLFPVADFFCGEEVGVFNENDSPFLPWVKLSTPRVASCETNDTFLNNFWFIRKSSIFWIIYFKC